MAIVTALRARGAQVAVELDGRAWRTLSVAVVVEVGLATGQTIGREQARTLARVLRRERADALAVRALARRERSRTELDERLARAGVREEDRRKTIERATRARLLDDARYAEMRARLVAARGVGDQLVLDDLARHGVDEALAREAVARLEPEAARAAAVIEARGRNAHTLRRLASRGFSEESLEQLIAELENGALR